MDDTLDDVLHEQWRVLRAWLETAAVLDRADEPAGLGTWTVGDLVVHLGLGLRLVTGIEAAPEGTVPITLGEYVAAYPPSAGAIADQTSDLREEVGEEVLAGLDAIAAQAFAHLAATTSAVVRARRGPISRDDYVRTRLLELVVHGDDLARVLGTSSHPGTDGAVAEVARSLAAAAPLEWIRLAGGRTSSDSARLPLF